MGKSILFFSRCELAYLYGSLDKYLTDKYNFIYIAYSDDEYKVLCEKFQIKNVIHFKNELRKITEGELSKITLEEIDIFLFAPLRSPIVRLKTSFLGFRKSLTLKNRPIRDDFLPPARQPLLKALVFTRAFLFS